MLRRAELTGLQKNGKLQGARRVHALRPSAAQKKEPAEAGSFCRRAYILEMMSTISAPMRFCASTVAAPMCGVQETIG